MCALLLQVLRDLAEDLPSSPLAHDLCLVLGDLNCRLGELPRDKAIDAVEHGQLASLLGQDELDRAAAAARGDSQLEHFNEAEVGFVPTYKYDRGTSTFDTSKKQRAPAWTDRVLWACAQDASVEVLRYTSVPAVVASDHKPIVALLEWKAGAEWP